MLQFGALLTDDVSSVNYNHNMFIIQATGVLNHDVLISIMDYIEGVAYMVW